MKRRMSLISDKVDNELRYFGSDSSKKYPYIMDESGRALVVNIDTGNVFTCDVIDDEPVNIKMYMTSSKSTKRDGYLVSVYFDKNNVYYLRHHVLNAMIAHKDKYDELVDSGYENPVVCHKDNCPFHNSPDNLEWGTQWQNIFHGKFVNSLHRYFEGVYTHLERNKKYSFIVLNERIENDWLLGYLENNNVKLPKESDCLSFDETVSILDYLQSRGYWKCKEVV